MRPPNARRFAMVRGAAAALRECARGARLVRAARIGLRPQHINL